MGRTEGPKQRRRTPAEIEGLSVLLISHASSTPDDRWVNVEAIADRIGVAPDTCRHVVRGLRDAGRWPWPSGKATSNAFLDTLRSMRDAGKSRAEIVAATGRTMSAVRKAIVRHGLAGVAKGPTTLESAAEFSARFRALALSGAGVTQIATEMTIATSTVYAVAVRLGVDIRRRKGWEDRTAPPMPVRDVAGEEVRYYLECRDAAMALDSADPRYPSARVAWLAAEKSVRPHLNAVGIRSGGRIVGVDCVGEVWVGRTRAVRVRGDNREVRCSS